MWYKKQNPYCRIIVVDVNKRTLSLSANGRVLCLSANSTTCLRHAVLVSQLVLMAINTAIRQHALNSRNRNLQSKLSEAINVFCIGTVTILQISDNS